MNKEIKARWIEALTDGTYEPQSGYLRSSLLDFCVLGVLTDIAVEDGIGYWERDASGAWFHTVEKADGEQSWRFALAPEVVEWAGLHSDFFVFEGSDGSGGFEGIFSAAELWRLMDQSGYTFSKIAEVIEKNF
jgi:hypothetical protein